MKTRIAVIGVGYLGRIHAAKFAAMEDVELVGVADVNEEAAREIAGKYGVRAATDYRELLPEVDAVSIVVPTTLHHEVACNCLAAGKDVFIEKPMTSTLSEADDLIARAAAKGRIIQVGHIERFNPAVMAMAGHLTHPLFIESHRIHTFKPRGVDVDVVLDLMIHDIDIILSIVDAPISQIHAVGVPVITPTTDIANARIIFANGCTANVTVSRISRDNMRRIRVFQPQSFVSVDYNKKEITVIRLTGEKNEAGLPREDVFHSSFQEADALAMELADFVTNVLQRATPRVSGQEGRQALAVALDIMGQIRGHVEKHRHLLGG
ncbi:MAG: Gfo/Idh/MocA family oxidoreductase [Thermodesulfobacteriota bacterium]